MSAKDKSKKISNEQAKKSLEENVKQSKKDYTESFAKVSEYQGKKVIRLHRNELDQFPFTFGVVKAELITLHIDKIKDFVQKYSKKD